MEKRYLIQKRPCLQKSRTHYVANRTDFWFQGSSHELGCKSPTIVPHGHILARHLTSSSSSTPLITSPGTSCTVIAANFDELNLHGITILWFYNHMKILFFWLDRQSPRCDWASSPVPPQTWRNSMSLKVFSRLPNTYRHTGKRKRYHNLYDRIKLF